jgi:hypothetical protein
MSFERVQRLVDVDENIFAAFVIDPAGNISELFVAPDSDLDKSKIEKIRSILDIKSVTISEREAAENLIGKHKWDIMESDKFKFIKLYPSGNLEHKMIVVIAACTKDPGDVADSVISYMNPKTNNQFITYSVKLKFSTLGVNFSPEYAVVF